LCADLDESEVAGERLRRCWPCSPLRQKVLIHRPADGSGRRTSTVALSSMPGVREHGEVSDIVGPPPVPAHRRQIPVRCSAREDPARGLQQPALVELTRRDGPEQLVNVVTGDVLNARHLGGETEPIWRVEEQGRSEDASCRRQARPHDLWSGGLLAREAAEHRCHRALKIAARYAGRRRPVHSQDPYPATPAQRRLGIDNDLDAVEPSQPSQPSPCLLGSVGAHLHNDSMAASAVPYNRRYGTRGHDLRRRGYGTPPRWRGPGVSGPWAGLATRRQGAGRRGSRG
jgi:hypothetical protein